jgi:hypothetical protein
MADLENGLYSGVNFGFNANDPTINFRYTTAIIKGEPNHWSIRGGNAQSGALSTFYNGAAPQRRRLQPDAQGGGHPSRHRRATTATARPARSTRAR